MQYTVSDGLLLMVAGGLVVLVTQWLLHGLLYSPRNLTCMDCQHRSTEAKDFLVCSECREPLCYGCVVEHVCQDCVEESL